MEFEASQGNIVKPYLKKLKPQNKQQNNNNKTILYKVLKNIA